MKRESDSSEQAVETQTNERVADATLVARVLDGDQGSFELIMRRYNRTMFRIARGIVTDSDEARDIVQASYVRAYYHLGDFRGPRGFRSWLGRITFNEALMRARRRLVLVDDDYVNSTQDRSDNGPEGGAVTHETLVVIQAAIDRLSDEFRGVFMLRAVEQLSVSETSEILDIKPATVKTRYHRARTLLQKELKVSFEEICRQTYEFGGEHCDAIVNTVLQRIG